jgi:hypothetical protein
MKRFLSLVTIMVCLASSLAAQTSSEILGTVTDESGAAIPDAKLVARNVATGLTYPGTSGESGQFRVPLLPPGKYEFSVEKAGFAKYIQSGIELQLGQRADLAVKLQVSSSAETITVSSEAPLINTTNSEVGVNIDSKRISELPLAPNRNILNIALQVAGVSQLSSGNSTFASGGVAFSVNGMRTRSNNFMIDGADSNNSSVGGLVQEINNPDTVAEFRMITNQFLPEYGRSAGSVITMTTKSGTNDFHGSAYWFYNSNAFNSRSNLDKRTFAKAPWRNEHQRAFTFGGPAIKNRTFFFGSMLRSTDNRFASGTAIGAAPTEAGRQALQSIAATRPQIRALLDNLPAAQSSTGASITATADGRTITVPTGTLSGAAPNTFAAWQSSVRVDHRFSEKHNLFGRVMYDTRQSVSGQAVPSGLTTESPAVRGAYNAGLTSNFRSNMFNELRLNYQRFTSVSKAADAKAITIPSIEVAALGLVGFNAADSRTAIGLGVNLPQSQINNNYQIANNLSILKGSHAFKVGVDMRRVEQIQDFNPTLRGRLSYETLQQLVDDTPAVQSINVLQPGLPTFQNYRYYDYFAFWQDEWRIKPTFTLTYGIRYETPGNAFAWLEKVNKEVVARNNNNPGYRMDPAPARDRNNWAPRVGFNWRLPKLGFLTGDNKMVLRGGYSRTYDLIYNNIALNIYSAWPFTQVEQRAAGTPGGFVYIDGIRAGTIRPPAPASPNLVTRTIVDAGFRAPLAEQFSVNVQRELKGGIAVTAGWIATKGTALFQSLDGNPTVPGTVGTTRVDPTRGIIRHRANSASSIYHSFQTSIEKRFSRGFQYSAHYTWSTFIDDASEVFNASVAGEVAVPQDSFNRRADRGRSTYDRPHRFTINSLWESPWMKDQKGVGYLVGGWSIGGFLTFQSGAPFSALAGADPGRRLSGIDSLIGNSIRANLNTNLKLSSMSLESILLAGGRTLFSAPTVTAPFGDTGRNILRADGINNLDFVINKRIRIPFEGHGLNLRFEFFNATNSRDFGIPTAAINSAAFGNQWNTNGGNRRIVMGARYAF